LTRPWIGFYQILRRWGSASKSGKSLGFDPWGKLSLDDNDRR